MTRRRIFDSLDLAAVRHAVSVRDIVALVIIGIIVAAIPVIAVLLGVDTENRR